MHPGTLICVHAPASILPALIFIILNMLNKIKKCTGRGESTREEKEMSEPVSGAAMYQHPRNAQDVTLWSDVCSGER